MFTGACSGLLSTEAHDVTVGLVGILSPVNISGLVCKELHGVEVWGCDPIGVSWEL